jgi:hypothetical protein
VARGCSDLWRCVSVLIGLDLHSVACCDAGVRRCGL